jgi:hypothetical protein
MTVMKRRGKSRMKKKSGGKNHEEMKEVNK